MYKLPPACFLLGWLTADSLSPHWETWEKFSTLIQGLSACPKGPPRALSRGCRRCCARIPAVSFSPSFLVFWLFLSVILHLLSLFPSVAEPLLSVYHPAQVCPLIFFFSPSCTFVFFHLYLSCYFCYYFLSPSSLNPSPTSCFFSPFSSSSRLSHSLTHSPCIWPCCEVISEEPKRDTSKRWSW